MAENEHSHLTSIRRSMRWETRVALPLSERASAGWRRPSRCAGRASKCRSTSRRPSSPSSAPASTSVPIPSSSFDAVGLADKLHAISSEPVGLTWRDWDSGEIHYCLPFGDFEKRYGAKYYVVHRSDLHRLLSEAVPQASIQLGKRCTSVESRNGSAGLSFTDGTSAEADVVVGCDGIRSAVRACLFGGEGPHYAGTMCWRALAPSERVAEGLSRPLCEPMVRRWRFRRQLLRSARRVHQFRLRPATARLDRAVLVGAEQRR